MANPLLPLLLAGLLALPLAAVAQIENSSPGKQRAANRRALREARRTDVPYKDTHLRVTRAQLKRGEGVRPEPEGADRLRFEGAGTPRVTEPKYPVLRQRRKKETK